MLYILENLPIFAAFIGVLVIFHELGHFLLARAFGVRVLSFSFGMGPRVLGFKRNGTDYRIGLLPLGGYVKMLGDTPGSDIAPADAPFAFANKPLWQRTLIVAAGPAFNMILAFLVYFGMLVGTHPYPDTRLGVVTQGEPAYNAGLRPGDRVVAIDGRPVEHWEQMREAIADKPDARLQMVYERNGERHDAIVATQNRPQENVFRETEQKGKIGVSLQFVKPILAVVDPESPAALAGLKTGDVVTHVGGNPVSAWHEVRAGVNQTAAGSPVVLTITRDGKTQQISLTPAAAPADLPADIFSAANLEALGDKGYTGLVEKDVIVSEVQPGTPADRIGLKVGDRLLKVSVTNPEGVTETRPIGVWGIDLAFIGVDARATLGFTWQRGRVIQQGQLHLEERSETDEFKDTRTTYVLGAQNDPTVVGTYMYDRHISVATAATEALHQVGQDMTIVGRALARLVQGTIPLKTMGGPMMLFVIAEKSAQRGLEFFLRTLAMISVNIGIMNLLPIPALDGGHLMFFGIEAVSRRPPSLRVREMAQLVGIAFILLLMVLVFHNDFMRFVLQ